MLGLIAGGGTLAGLAMIGALIWAGSKLAGSAGSGSFSLMADSEAKASRETVAEMKSLVALAQRIKTVQDLEAAAPRWEQSKKRLADIDARFKAFEESGRDLTPQDRDAFAKTYNELQILKNQLEIEQKRLAALPGGDMVVLGGLQPALMGVIPILFKLDPWFTSQKRAEAKFKQERNRLAQQAAQSPPPAPANPAQPSFVYLTYEQNLEKVRKEHGEATTVEIYMRQGLKPCNEVLKRVREIAPQHSYCELSILQSGPNEYKNCSVVVGPIDDLQALADVIDFGRVTEIDPKIVRIDVEVDPDYRFEPGKGKRL